MKFKGKCLPFVPPTPKFIPSPTMPYMPISSGMTSDAIKKLEALSVKAEAAQKNAREWPLAAAAS